MLYRIELSRKAQRQLRALPHEVQRRLGRAIDGIAVNPRLPGSRKLSGATDLWRVRVGDYRLVYRVWDEVLLILVMAVGHRKDVYDRLT